MIKEEEQPLQQKRQEPVESLEEQDAEQQFNPVMAYTAISIMLLLTMSKHWQQSALSFFYGFQGVGDKFLDPKYEMSAAFPEMNVYYGMLSGMWRKLDSHPTARLVSTPIGTPVRFSISALASA